VQFELGDAAIGVQVAIETADRFLSDPEIDNSDTAISGGSAGTARNFHAKGQWRRSENVRLNFLYLVKRSAAPTRSAEIFLLAN